MNKIEFYKVNEPYGFFSNFSPHPIYINNEIWKTVEHYFQASKFLDPNIINKIKLIDSPMEAKLIGRDIKNQLRDDWETIKEDFMYNGLKHKFMQHPVLMQNLLSTGNDMIIEKSLYDEYWGSGKNNEGKNRLGFLLMNLRNEIRNKVECIDEVFPPWIAFGNIDQNDLFWRMGLGEDYLYKWTRFLLKTDLNLYIKKYPPTEDWEDIYDWS